MPQVKQQRPKLLRRTRQHPSWITFENNLQSHECQILDISADGAKLVADIANYAMQSEKGQYRFRVA